MAHDDHGSARSPAEPSAGAASGVDETPRADRRIAAWLQPRDILLDVEGRDCEQVLREAALAIGRRCDLQPTLVFDALWRREQAGSTALGKGFAIPHARLAGIPHPTTFYVRCAKGLDIAAPDDVPVRDILVILVPNDGADDDHLRLLALVARLASDPSFRDALRDAHDPAVIAGAFDAAIERADDAPFASSSPSSRAG